MINFANVPGKVQPMYLAHLIMHSAVATQIDVLHDTHTRREPLTAADRSLILVTADT